MYWRTIISILTAPTATALAGPAIAQTTAFAYDPSRVPVGTAYEYTKSNLDGSQPIRIVLWTAGPGMAGAEAWIWAAQDDGRLLAIESPVPDNPGWSSFRLELRSTSYMGEDAWEAYIAEEVGALADHDSASPPADTTGLRVEYAPVDSAVAPIITADAEAGGNRIETFFAAPFRESVLVRVFPDRAAFDDYTTASWGFATECWMVGAGATRTLVLLSPRAWATEACDHDPGDPEELADLVAHELVHVYHMQNNPSNEFEGADEIGWFVEGLATYVSGQLDHGHRARAREAIAADAVPEHLSEAWSGPYRYGVSGTLVEYVDTEWGREVLRALLGATSQAQILTALGVDEAGLLERWRAWVMSRP